MSGIISNTQAGNFTVNGAYVYEAPAQPVTPVGPQTNLVGIVGVASWGPVNTQQVFSDASSAFNAFGTLTNNVNSLVRTALSAMPEGNNFVGVRVTDNTDTKAVLNIIDTATGTPGVLVVLTAVYTGSYANLATARVDLVRGTLAAGPVFNVTIAFPNTQPNVYQNIVGSATANGAFAAATFQANVIAAINGTAPNTVPNPYFVASAGASTASVLTATVLTASGGTDGASTITGSVLVGVDGTTGAKGLYALRGAVAGGQVVLAGLTDTSQFANLAAFAQQEACIAHISIASGNTSDQVVAAKASASASSRFVSVNAFWDYVQDTNSGQKLLVDPSGAIAGIIASLPAYLDPCNKPRNGKTGIVATELSVQGRIGQATQGELQTNAIQYLTNQMPRGGGLFGLPHGLASDGSNLSDTRMLNYCALSVLQILGPFVGEMQSAQSNDPTRSQARAALSAFFQNQLNQSQIAAFQVTMDTTNNTQTTVSQGFLIGNIAVTTLAGVKFALAALQVGTNVQIQVSQAA